MSFPQLTKITLPFFEPITGKSSSEALIFASINSQFDNRLFMELFGNHHEQSRHIVG